MQAGSHSQAITANVQRYRDFEDCRDKCNDEDQCKYFKYKVISNFFTEIIFGFSRSTEEYLEGLVF